MNNIIVHTKDDLNQKDQRASISFLFNRFYLK